MRILFSDDDLQAVCSEEKRQKRELGAACAKKLRTRLADLAAASRVSDLVAGRPHPLVGDRQGQFSVSLEGGKRLVFEPANEPIPTRADGAIAWDHVTEVRIIYVGDYHD